MKLISTMIVFLSCAIAVSQAQAKTSVVIVQGLAGEDYYQRHFDEQAEKIATASAALTEEGDTHIFGHADHKEASKEIVMPILQSLVESSEDDDLILVYLIGHGSYDGRDYKFNIAGADITGLDIVETFSQESLRAAVVLINTTSSSGALLKPLAETNIHLLSATKSGAERTATRFGRHFADGFLEAEADINKNKSLSLQEAFNYAVRETQAFYDDEGLLATENPRLQMAKNKVAADQIKLANLESRPSVPAGSEEAGLYAQRDELDRQIDTLRLRRINLTDEEYAQRFQDLMIQLAILQSEIESDVDVNSLEDAAL